MNEKVMLDAKREFAQMLPKMTAFAHFRFSALNLEERYEAVQETIALAWLNYSNARPKGKTLNASTLIHYAALSVASGRKFAGSSSTDVLSEETQIKGRATVEHFGKPPANSDDLGKPVEYDGAWGKYQDALINRRQWERPFEHVRIKLDYQAFFNRGEASEDEKSVFRMLSKGFTTSDMADQIGVSSPRICQLKNSLGRKLKNFFGQSMRSPLMKRPLLNTSAA